MHICPEPTRLPLSRDSSTTTPQPGKITNSYTTALYTTDPSSQWNAGFAYTNEGTISSAYATEYSGNTANAARYGFVESNTGTITNAYWYAATASGATPVTDGTGSTATQLTDATAAATLSSYTGFNSSIWGQGQAGSPVLRNIMVYIYTDTSTDWWTAGHSDLRHRQHVIRPEPVAGMGLTGRRRDRPGG